MEEESKPPFLGSWRNIYLAVMGIFARQQRAACWAAKRTVGNGSRRCPAVGCQPVDVGRGHIRILHKAQRLGAVLVAEYPDDVGLGWLGGNGRFCHSLLLK